MSNYIKYFSTIKFSLVIALTLASPSRALEADPDANKQIQCYIEMIEVDTLEYALLMSNSTASNNHNALRNTLITKVKTGKAKLVDNQVFSLKANQRHHSENSLIYPTSVNYQPGNFLLQTVKNPAERATAPDGKIIPPEFSFNREYLGTTYEIIARISQVPPLKESIHLELNLTKSNLIGQESWGSWTTMVRTLDIILSTFYSTIIKQDIEVNNGKFLMISTYTPSLNGRANTAKKVLVFVRATIMK